LDSLAINNIWERCTRQDRKAQALLYHHFAKKMYAVCLRYAHTSLEADDILQNSFVKVFTKHYLYDGKGSLEGWIKRIVVNTAIETHRKNKRSYMENIDDIQLSVSSLVGTEQTGYQELLALIQQLPLGYKTVFNLYAIEGYSHKEIAEMLSISEGNSKSQLSRARQWLQNKLVKTAI